MTSKYNLSNQSEQTAYWARVKKSFAGPPGDAYLKASNGRSRGEQWHIEWEPLYPFRYEGDGARSRSQNLPTPGMPVRKDTPLIGRYEAFKVLGFDMPTEQDFSKIEGHIFYVIEEERTFGKFAKNDAWPVMCNDAFLDNCPDDYVVLSSDTSSGGGGPAPITDMWGFVADLFVGENAKTVKPMQKVLQAGNPQLNTNQEIMGFVNKNKLVEELVSRKKLEIGEDGLLVRVGS